MKALVLAMALSVVVSGNLFGDEPAPVAGTGTLVVFGNGFEHDGGQAGVNLFLKQEDMFDKPFKKVFAKIVAGKAEVKIPDLPFGDYAIVLFHDENNNGEVDHNFLKIPNEPLGYPNGFKFGLLSGMPNFEKLHIRFDKNSSPYLLTVD